MRKITLEPKPIREGWNTAVAEETLYGIVSRYHIRSGNLSSRVTNLELTDNASAHLSVPFPNNVSKILNRLVLPSSSAADLVEQHTILPYFRPFLQSDHYAKILENLTNGFGRSTKISLGLTNCGMRAKDVLRFCPQCGKEDRSDFGIATWYRAHQLPGVLVCPYHGLRLKVSAHYLQDKDHEHLLLPNETQFSDDLSVCIEGRVYEKLLLFARLSTQILSMKKVENGPFFLRERYLSLLQQKGFSTRIRCHRQEALGNEFSNFWFDLEHVEPFSTVLTCCREPRSWLKRLCNEPRGAIHPLKHLLLIGFIGNDIDSLLNYSIEENIKPTETRRFSDVDEDERKVRVAFNIGMSLQQLSKAVGLNQKITRIRAARVGIFFPKNVRKITESLHSQVRIALADGEPVRDIMKMSQLSMASIYEILSYDPGLELQRSAALLERRRTCSRSNLLAAIESYPLPSFWSLKTVVPKDFDWLYRNDKDWLMERVQLIGLRKSSKRAVDWGPRDEVLVEEVKLAVAEILGIHDSPVRVCVSEIARRTNHGPWILNQRKKLPKSDKLINQVVETTEHFKVRCLSEQGGDEI